MKRRSMMAVAGLVLSMMSMAGCGGQETESGSAILSTENEENGNKADESEPGAKENEVEQDGSDADGVNADKPEEAAQTEQDDRADDSVYSISNEDIFIGGTVRSVSQDSFVISRTLVDDDGYIKMPEAGDPEEELVTVRFADAVTFERWTISGGDVDKEESSFAKVKEGSGLEAQGYFDGAEFVAKKVIIEIYK